MKLIHITAPNSSTGEERAAEEKRVARMFPGTGVVCLLEGWKIEVHDIPSRQPTGVTVQAFEVPAGISPEQVRNIVTQTLEDAAEKLGSLA